MAGHPRARPSETRFLLAAVCVAAAVLGGPATPAAETRPATTLPTLAGLEACRLSFGQTGPLSEDRQQFSGYVDLNCDEVRIQAERLIYDGRSRRVEAEENVALSWQANRLAGSRLVYDFGDQTGWVEDARGVFPPDAIVDARRIEKISEDEVVIHDGVFTSCTQPIPYWSFRIRKGRFHLGNYAYLRGVSMRAGRVPVFYTPYLVWPIKGDRATGLLFPQWGTSRTLGAFAGGAFFWAIADNADATFYADYYDLAGPAAGLEVNWLPNDKGALRLDTYYLRDQRTVFVEGEPVRNEKRYKASLRGEQRFAGGWRAVASLNQVSDFRYYTDFERGLAGSSTPATVSAINVTNNWSHYSFAARAQRREQFFLNSTLTPFVRSLRSDLTLEVRPEVELRSRSRRLGRSPFYLSFESSVNFLAKRDRSPAGRDLDGDGTPGGIFEAEYRRFDLGGRLSAPFAPTSWLDIEPALLFRETYYTDSQAVDGSRTFPTGRPLSREYARASLEIVGPKLFRVYEPPADGAGPRIKHVIEPRVFWEYAPETDYRERVPLPGGRSTLAGAILLDEIDSRFNQFDDTHVVTYGLRQRILARRPAAAAQPRGELEGAEAPPWGPASLLPPAEPPPSAPEPALHPPSDPSSGGEVGAGQRPPLPTGPSMHWPLPAGGRPGAVAPGAVPPSGNPVEIASFELSQSYSFESFLSRLEEFDRVRVKDASGNPVRDPFTGEPVFNFVKTGEQVRRFGPINLAARFNPALSVSLDLRAQYDLLRDTFASESLSASARSLRAGYVNLSWVRRRAVPPFLPATSTINLTGGTALMSRRLTLDVQANYDRKADRLLDQGLRVGYYTQCCGFVAEYTKRDFLDNERRELRFIIDLKGIGKFLDLNRGADR